MRIIFFVLIALLTLSAPVSATGLQLFKPKPKELTMVGAAPAMTFSEFRIQQGSGRSDWFVNATNTSSKNLPRNHYKLQAYQIDQFGKRGSAGETITLNRDIRPGGTVNFTRQFTPSRDISKIVIEIVSRTDNTVFATGTFSASSAQSTPGAAVAASGAAATPNAQAAAQSGGFTPTKLALSLKETLQNKSNGVTLTVKNEGSGVVDLRLFKIEVAEHLLMRPDVKWSAGFNEKLRPGQSVSSKWVRAKYGMCANLAEYRASATGQGVTFTDTLEVQPPNLTINDMRIEVANLGSKGKMDEFTTLLVEMDVVSQGDRVVSGTALEGNILLLTAQGKLTFPFITYTTNTIRPGKNLVKASVSFGAGEFGGADLTRYGDLWSYNLNNLHIKARLVNSEKCGVPVAFTNYKFAKMK